jgi:hypothetical protein
MAGPPGRSAVRATLLSISRHLSISIIITRPVMA